MTIRPRACALALVGMTAFAEFGLTARLILYGPVAASFGPIRIRARDPLQTAAIGTALLVLLLVGSGRLRAVRRLAVAAAAVLGALGLVMFARQAPFAFPIGDAALLESYTLLTTRGELMLGPYSRFAWHHPGPLYFWALAPFYAMAGYETPGLHAGALAINVLSLATLVWVVQRAARGASAFLLLASVTAYTWLAHGVLVSIWNPHVTVLPAAALLIIAAAAAAGDVALLPIVALFATFVTQTHVGFAPYAVALVSFATVGGFVSARMAAGTGDFRRTANRTAWLLVALWSFPLAEQFTRSPGNMTRLVRFFLLESRGGQPGAMAIQAWADAVSAALRRGFHVPAGVLFVPHRGWLLVSLVVVQVLLVAAAGLWAARARRRFEAALAAALLIGSGVALWSVTRIVGDLVDHEIYWMSALGVLNLAAIAAVAVTAFGERTGSRWFVPPMVMRVAWMAPVGLALGFGVYGLSGPGGLPLVMRNDDRIVRALSDGIRAHLHASGAQKALVRMDVGTWGFTAGVVLQLERAGVPLAVEDGAVPLFSDAVAVDGREDIEITIALAPRHDELARRPNNVIVASRDRVYADAVAITPNPNR